MPLPDTPNGGIAGHLSQRLDAVREQKGPTTGPRRGKRGFCPGVAAADHNHIEGGGKLHRFAQEKTETDRILKLFHDERQCFTWNFNGPEGTWSRMKCPLLHRLSTGVTELANRFYSQILQPVPQRLPLNFLIHYLKYKQKLNVTIPRRLHIGTRNFRTSA